jgi:hypothetical protein
MKAATHETPKTRIGPFLTGKPPKPARQGPSIGAGDCRPVLAECREAIARRFAIPPHAAARDGQRCVVLWRLVALTSANQGRELRIVSLERGAPLPWLAADLSAPIGEQAWTSAFLPVIAHACHRHRMQPRDVAGPAGLWLQGSLAAMFARHVDFESLRAAVHEYLALDPAVLALTHRVFGPDASAAQFNWVGENEAAIASRRVIPFPRAWSGA